MPHEQLLKKLISLGLTGYEAKIFFSMIGRNSLTASEISRLSGVPRQRTYDVLNGLHLKGLCVEVPGDVIRYHASNPKDALMGMLVDRNREFQTSLERQRDTAIDIAGELAGLNQPKKDGVQTNGTVQVFHHPNQMLRKYDELLLSAEEEILKMNKRPYIQARAEKTYEKVKEGVSIRFLLDEELIEKEPLMIRTIFGLYGVSGHRFMSGVPLKFSVFDRKKVLFYLTNGMNDDITAVAIENEQYARSMADFFEMMWEKGTPSSERMEDVQRAIGEVKA